ncbi:MAG: SpoIIE family protein phosphatase [Planctomycetota bacterium]
MGDRSRDIDGGPVLGRLRAEHRSDSGRGEVVELRERVLVVGRSGDADVRLDDPTVSRRHAELHWEPYEGRGIWRVVDLNSANGVWVKDKQVDEAELRADQPVRLGAFTLHLLGEASDGLGGSGVEAGVESTLVWREDAGGARTGGGGGVGVASLDELSAPVLEARHIRFLLDFGQSLIEIEQAAARRAALCEVMVKSEMHCRCATMIRVWVDQPERPPRVVSPSVTRKGEALEEPHVSRSVLGALVARRQPVMATNEPTGELPEGAIEAGDDSSWAELSINAEQAAITVMAAPVGEGQDAAGAWLDVVYVVATREVGSSAWLTLLELAARLYKEGESAWALRAAAIERAAIEREQAQASYIQRGLVPEAPEVDGFEVGVWFDPCLAVGGDYVDVMGLADGRVLAVLADVAGKGLHAALVTAAVHAVVHAGVGELGERTLSLTGLLERLNRHLCEFTPDDSFVTLVAAVLDPATGQGEVCNAGHPPVMLIGHDGSVSELDSGVNLVLGCLPTELVSEPVSLEAGQTLVFYSDGLNESVNESKRMLEIEGLREMLEGVSQAEVSVSGRVSGLRSALGAYQGTAARADDETALFLCRLGV